MEGSGIDIKKSDKTFDGVDGVYLLKSAEEFKRLSREKHGEKPVKFKADGYEYTGYKIDADHGTKKQVAKASQKIYEKMGDGGDFVSNTLRIGTWNVGDRIVSTEVMTQIFDKHDIVLLQEVNKSQFGGSLTENYNDLFNIDDLYSCWASGQYSHDPKKNKNNYQNTFNCVVWNSNAVSYNGVVTQSYSDVHGMRTTPWIIFQDTNTARKIVVMSVHLPVPNPINDRILNIISSINDFVEETYYDYVFVGGDFNMTGIDREFKNSEKFTFFEGEPVRINKPKTSGKGILVKIDNDFYEYPVEKRHSAGGVAISDGNQISDRMVKNSKLATDHKHGDSNYTNISLDDVFFNNHRFEHVFEGNAVQTPTLGFSSFFNQKKFIPLAPFKNRLDYIFWKKLSSPGKKVELLSVDFGVPSIGINSELTPVECNEIIDIRTRNPDRDYALVDITNQRAYKSFERTRRKIEKAIDDGNFFPRSINEAYAVAKVLASIGKPYDSIKKIPDHLLVSYTFRLT